jgi:4-hydroxy-tetrahydrodipicolinate synthase
MVNSFLKGDLEGARKIHYELLSVFSLVFCETNPIPVKAAMHWLGYSENTLRLPMTSLTASAQADELKKQIFHLRSLGYE